MAVTKILLVCTGNTCRSSMAEALLKRMLAESGDLASRFSISSAGLGAFDGSPASEEAVNVMREYGIDISDHRSRSVTREMVADADIILTMTLRHKQIMIERFPESRSKVFTLKEYAGSDLSLDDVSNELDGLHDRIEGKKTEFYNKYGDKLEELNNRRVALRRELNGVERQIEELRAKFDECVACERDTIGRLEERLRTLDIVDPFGGDISAYRKTAVEIDEALKRLLKSLDTRGEGFGKATTKS